MLRTHLMMPKIRKRDGLSTLEPIISCKEGYVEDASNDAKARKRDELSTLEPIISCKEGYVEDASNDAKDRKKRWAFNT